MRDLLLPRTDAGVLAQFVLLAVVWASAMWLLRPQREWQLLVSGVAMLILGWFALRAVH